MSHVKKVTKSFKFILPMLGEYYGQFGEPESVFVGDVDKPEFDNHIFVLYGWDGSKYFAAFEAKLREHPLFEDYYDPTKQHVMFIFKVPEKYQAEYNLFKEANPSCFGSFSVSYKNHILKFFNGIFDLKTIKKILWKDESLYKELETSLGVKIPRELDNISVPDMEIEIFNKEKLTQHV